MFFLIIQFYNAKEAFRISYEMLPLHYTASVLTDI